MYVENACPTQNKKILI